MYFAESGNLATEQILGEQAEVEDCEGYEDENQDEEAMAMVEGSPSDAGMDTELLLECTGMVHMNLSGSLLARCLFDTVIIEVFCYVIRADSFFL